MAAGKPSATKIKTTGSSPQTIGGKVGGSFAEIKDEATNPYGFSAAGASPMPPPLSSVGLMLESQIAPAPVEADGSNDYRKSAMQSPEETMFKGSLVALITPFRDDELDEGAFQQHVAWQIEQGTRGLVPCGTTGKSPALADHEQKRLVTLCVEVAKDKQIPVIAGTGTNSTEHTVALTRQAKQAGADAALVVCPYYDKRTQEGLFQHFQAIHDSVDLPIIIYNIPGRSAVDMTNATMARLAKLPNIVGVKDATNDLARPLRMRVDIGAASVCCRERMPPPSPIFPKAVTAASR